MKKWAIVLATVGLASSFIWNEEANASSQVSSKATSSKYITAAKAKEIALEELGGKVVDIEFEREGRHVFYELEIRTETEEIEVEVDAVSGELFVTERERLRGVKSSKQPLKESVEKPTVKPGKQASTGANSDSEATVKPDQKAEKQTETKYITREEAIEIAKERVGDRAVVTDVEREGNRYEIELKRGKYEYEVKINATTGKVIKVKVERD